MLHVAICALLIAASGIVPDLALFIALIAIYEYFVFKNGNTIQVAIVVCVVFFLLLRSHTRHWH
jgi:hypothetical protein